MKGIQKFQDFFLCFLDIFSPKLYLHLFFITELNYKYAMKLYHAMFQSS